MYVYGSHPPGHPRELRDPLSLVNGARGNANFSTGRDVLFCVRKTNLTPYATVGKIVIKILFFQPQ